jgi:glycosylphosphatidylinositol deacylase
MRAPYKPVDYFALEFNEDFSALHGPTLALQTAYTRAAVAYVLSRYAPGTQVVVVGHSMGGIVGVSLLPSADIAAVITLATPHALPPARFDSRIEKIYEQNWRTLAADPTPVVSICGGATDTLIPAESCVLAASPMLGSNANNSAQASALTRVPFRRTVFASALEGAWTGVDHVVMVWCHQVRWRVARAALEVFAARQPTEREAVLDRWLSDGSRLPDAGSYAPSVLHSVDAATVVDGRLRLERPREARVYLLLLDGKPRHLTLLLSGGAVLPVAPHHAGSLRASVHLCSSTEHCTPLVPHVHKLLPLPVAGKPFPVPEEGADESEGTVLFEADVPSSEGGYVAVNIEHADGSGWLVAGVDEKRAVTHPATVLSRFFVLVCLAPC